MVSRSNYVAITLIMCVVLLMFQLTGISENVLMNTGENIYAQTSVPEELEKTEQQRYEAQTESLLLADGTEDCVGLAGEEKDACLTAGRNWCIAQKREYCRYDSLADAAADEDGAGFLIADGTKLEAEDVEALDLLSAQGRHVVISGLPEEEVLDESPELTDSLGILDIAEDEITVDGFRLFAGLVMGGETVYEKYEQEMPYVRLGSSVTAYAVGWSEDAGFQELENEELPAIIWRYAPDEGKRYIVNGDYLTGQLAAGILTGFAADCEEVSVYPVVNAQVSVVENYPVLADENREVMETEYGQSSSLVFRDILWPSIATVYYDTDDAMTVTGALRLDYDADTELDESLLQYYYEQITKMSGEMGISGYQVSDVPLEEKLAQDLEVYEQVLPDYEILTFQAGGLKEEEYEDLVGEGNLLEDVNTVLKDYDGQDDETFFTYLENGVLQLPVYMDSRVMNNDDDFRSRCLQTAYGYFGTALDTSKVIYPDSGDDVWNIISNDWSKNYRPFRVPFECFEKTTASEADRRVRNYLALEYETELTELTAGTEKIELHVDAPDGDSYFVLRVHGDEVTAVSGGSYEKIEDGWYLLTVTDDTAEVTLEQTDHADYYIE